MILTLTEAMVEPSNEEIAAHLDKIWDKCKELDANEDYAEFTPKWSFTLFGVTVGWWRKPKLEIDALSTHPYQIDGETPLVFTQIAWVEFMTEWKWYYKWAYKRQYGYLPQDLDPKVK